MIDDDTQPHDISDLLPLLDPLDREIVPGTDLTSPRGHRGYVAGRSFDDEKILIFVLLEGHGKNARATTVGVRREHLRGWYAKGGIRV